MVSIFKENNFWSNKYMFCLKLQGKIPIHRKYSVEKYLEDPEFFANL